MHYIKELLSNHILAVTLLSWLFAQILMVIINAIVTKKFDITRFFGDGGMPSAHSATVSALATICGLVYGLGSFEFAVTFIFATVVCRDAMGVRLETGKQAVILNEIVESFEELTKEDITEVKLKEFVGHTPIQVIAGILLGITSSALFFFFFMVK